MKNNRNARIESAKQTLQIIEHKQYFVENKAINLAEEIRYSVDNSKLYTSEMLDDLLVDIDSRIKNENRSTTIIVENCTSMQAAENRKFEGKIACLNFASAKNAGGGFISGAQAQEESLARASSLYLTQIQFHDEMYEYNRKRDTLLYSDRMIYSPAVTFFKDDNDKLLLEPYRMDILTSPAVNIGAMHQNRRMDELSLAEQTMRKRIDKMLALFYINNAKNIILGAWGCGVFRNDPIDIANYFAYFFNANGKYSKCFDNIVFAVYDTGKNQENIKAFEKVFK